MARSVIDLVQQSDEEGITLEEWRKLPETFSSSVAGHVIGKSQRFCTNHAEELGAVRIGGVWFFSRKALAAVMKVEL